MIFFKGTTAFARFSDPATSHAAAKSIEMTHMEMEVFLVIRKHGPLTSEEVANLMGVGRDSVTPRIKPLRKKKMVGWNGEKKGSSGRNQTLWKALI